MPVAGVLKQLRVLLVLLALVPTVSSLAAVEDEFIRVGDDHFSFAKPSLPRGTLDLPDTYPINRQ